MPVLSVYVDDRTFAILQRFSAESGRPIEELASAAVESEALRSLPPPVDWPAEAVGAALIVRNRP